MTTAQRRSSQESQRDLLSEKNTGLLTDKSNAALNDNNNGLDYGDEVFEIDDLSPTPPGSREGRLETEHKATTSFGQHATLSDLETGIDAASQGGASTPDIEQGHLTQETYDGRGRPSEKVGHDDIAPPTVTGRNEVAETGSAICASDEKDGSEKAAVPPERSRRPEGEDAPKKETHGLRASLRRPSNNSDGEHSTLLMPPEDVGENVHGLGVDVPMTDLDMESQAGGKVGDEETLSRGDMESDRWDQQGSTISDDAIEPSVPQPSSALIGGGEEHRLPQKPNGSRCGTRGRYKERIARQTTMRRLRARAGIQESYGQRRRRSSSPSQVEAGLTSKIRRDRQEKLIQKLVRDNEILERKVTGYRLALQLSADEGDLSSMPSFSTAMQQASPPAFPRDGGTPAPSPRVARGWAHKSPPPVGRITPIERNLSYTALVRQLDSGVRRWKALQRINESLGVRVSDLENGTVLRLTQSRLSEREQEIVALREELSVTNRLARAQDRKFEGSHGYALNRRLWLAEEELRVARSTISTLGVEIRGLRQARRARRGHFGTAENAIGTPSRTSAHQTSPRRQIRRRRSSRQDVALRSNSLQRRKNGENMYISDGERARTATTAARGQAVEMSGSPTANRRTVQSANGEFFLGAQAAKNQPAEEKVEMLQAALASMRSKAKGELRAARGEIDSLKEDKAALERALDAKTKEVRMQLLQVNRLKQEIRDLSAGVMRLEEASCVVAPGRLPRKTKGSMSAAASTGGSTLDAKYGGAVSERRVKSAAVCSNRAAAAAIAGRALLNSSEVRRAPVASSGGHVGTGQGILGGSIRRSSEFSAMGWNKDWVGDGTTAQSPVGAEEPAAPAVAPPLASANVESAMAGVPKDGNGGEHAKENDMVEKEKEMTVVLEEIEVGAAPQAVELGSERKTFHRCPLSGILDMVEPPLRSHRRSYYNEDDGKVYKVRNTSDVTTIADIGEAPREEDRLKCIVDFKGRVQHGEGCILRHGGGDKSTPSDGRSLVPKDPPKGDTADPSEKDGDQDTPCEPVNIPTSLGIAVREWHKDDKSDWDPAQVGPSGRLPMMNRRTPRNSCVSLAEEGRFTPTIDVVRRPTHFCVESVPELTA